jgi:hypothetical protein
MDSPAGESISTGSRTSSMAHAAGGAFSFVSTSTLYCYPFQKLLSVFFVFKKHAYPFEYSAELVAYSPKKKSHRCDEQKKSPKHEKDKSDK